MSSRTMRVLAEKIVQEVQYGSERSEEDVSAGFLNIATQDDGECKKESLSQERWLRWDDLETISSAAKHFGEDEKYIVIRQRIAELLSVSDEQNAQIITQHLKPNLGNRLRDCFLLQVMSPRSYFQMIRTEEKSSSLTIDAFQVSLQRTKDEISTSLMILL